MNARQSTSRTFIVGPVLDADGVAVTDCVIGDFKVSKNGGAPAALNGSATLTHRHTGHYSLAATASDFDTVGTAQFVIDDSVNACPPKDFDVLEEAVYDALFASSAGGFASITALSTLDGKVDTIDGIVDSILVDTTEIGVAGAGLTALASATNLATVDTVVDAIKVKTDSLTFTVAGKVDSNLQLVKGVDPDTAAVGAAAIADAVWDESTTGHTTSGTFGEQVKTDVDAILADTGTDGVVVAAGSKTGYALSATGLNLITSWTVDIAGDLSGNIGGNLVGSVGSIEGITFPTNFSTLSINGSGLVTLADGSITAAKIAADAITAAKLASDVTTEIQSGLATATALSNVATEVNKIPRSGQSHRWTNEGSGADYDDVSIGEVP